MENNQSSGQTIPFSFNLALKHNFQTKAHDLADLFNEVDRMSQFMRKLERQAAIDPVRYETDKYLGDGFEFFIELLLALHPVDSRTGVYQYSPIQENDNGVDGIGLNIQLEPSVVQIKYRTNTSTQLTATKDSLAHLFSDGMLAHDVVADNKNKKNYRHFVFTTAEGLHFYTDQEMFKHKVRCIGYKQLRTLVDRNIPFWTYARNYVESVVQQQNTKK